jgi:hypothetical protein
MTKPIGLGVAFAVGFIFAMFFFFFNDPDRARFNAVVTWYFAFLAPAAAVTCLISYRSWVSKAAMIICGVFVGTCVAIFVYYPDRANLWPIAATIWTITAVIPVLLGSTFGRIVAAALRMKKQP